MNHEIISSVPDGLGSVLLSVVYLVAAVFFILSLRGLSSQETARQGNLYGIIGMVMALVATALDERVMSGGASAYGVLAVTIVVGGVIGMQMARSVAMTAMPELVALLHSFVGLAAVLVGYASFLDPNAGTHGTVHLIEVFVDVFIGAITFTGSIVAYLKLKGTLGGKPLILPARHWLNLAVVIGSVALAIPFVQDHTLWPLLVMTGLASLLGVHLVMAIGGADMPVVVSMLNSYSGWTAAAAGFMLSNDLLIVTGALVGSSGAILSYIMCVAMNRSIWNVIFGGFGSDSGAPSKPTGEAAPAGDATVTDADAVVDALLNAKRAIIVPGYGMAVARAQHAVHEMTEILRKRGTEVRFGIHPVAGRLPGHMNVLLAEANVPYDIVLEMDELNDDFPETDVSLVIGANDIVNPSAQTDGSSPIYGMPVLEVWKSARTVVFKRSLRTGYAGVDNPLFYMDETRMLLGDAKDSVEKLVTGLRSRAA